jgi:hypothetical protein
MYIPYKKAVLKDIISPGYQALIYTTKYYKHKHKRNRNADYRRSIGGNANGTQDTRRSGREAGASQCPGSD